MGGKSPGRIRLVSPATIAGGIQFDMSSAINGRTYRIYVYEPMQDRPPGGYPVAYLTDANALFCTAAMQAEMMELNTLVVGIGYPTDDRKAPDILRFRDLTWNAPSAEVGEDFRDYMQSPSISYGGAEEYFRFIKEEVEPAVAATYAVDRTSRTIFGHSLGGLFALYLLFKYPGEFSVYAAGSPAIWLNECAILRDFPAFRQRIESGQAAPRVLITVGSLEGETKNLRVPESMSRARFEEMIRRARLVDNARDLAAQLGGIHGTEPYGVECCVFEGETHQSVVAATISRMLRFAART